MASRTEVIRLDDLTGESGDDVENVAFAISGRVYEIDLSRPNRQALADALAPYLSAARPTTGHVGPRTPRPSEASPAQAVRAWARANDVPCPPRGRVPAELVQRWREAGAPKP